MSILMYILLLLMGVLSGVLFGWYERLRREPSFTWKYHLVQWAMIVGFWATAFLTGLHMQEDTVFAYGGVTMAIFVSSGIGYVGARKVFF